MRRRVTNVMEDETADRWCRRFFVCFGRPGYARRGKNMIVRRERRESKQEIQDNLEDFEVTFRSFGNLGYFYD